MEKGFLKPGKWQKSNLKFKLARPRNYFFVPVMFLTFMLIFFISSSCTKEKSFPEKIRLGYLQSDIHQLPAFVALEQGFFKSEGLNVEVAGVFPSGPEEMSAFASGDLDVGYVGISPFITARANGKIQAVAVAQCNAEGSALVVAKKEPVSSVTDLKGKTVAIPGYATVQDILLRRLFLNNKIDLKQVNIIVLKPPEMIGALQTGQIDAFLAWEPYPSKAVGGQIGRVLARSGQIWPGHPCCFLVVQEKLLKERPQFVYSLVRAHSRAIKFIREKPEEAMKIGQKYTGMDEEVIQNAFSNVKYDYFPDPVAAEEYVNLIKNLGYISVQNDKQFAQDMFYLKFVDQIKQNDN